MWSLKTATQKHTGDLKSSNLESELSDKTSNNIALKVRAIAVNVLSDETNPRVCYGCYIIT